MRIAIAQTPGTRLEEWPRTRAIVVDLLSRAADLRADVVLLPECVWPAYYIGSSAAYFAAREAGLPDPQHFLDLLSEHARRLRLAICAGYIEEQGGGLANTAGIIGADGRLCGVHRKCFLWDFDHEFFRPGDGVTPIETPFGTVGVMICADARLPEIAASLAARGARLILQPTAWVNVGTADRLSNPQPEFLIAARACELGVPIASASKWGCEGETTLVGSSLICDADGAILAQAGTAETTVLVADVEPRTPKPLMLTAAQRTALLTPAAPAPPRADVPPLALVPLPMGADEETCRSVAASQSGPGRPVLAVGWQEEEAGRARGAAGASGAHAAVICRTLPAPLDVDGIRIATLEGPEVRGFAAARVLTLGGVHVVVVLDADVPPALLRARACENRIFVVAINADGWRVFDPRGQTAGAGTWSPVGSEKTGAVLDVGSAADKRFARNTDLLSGRRPAQYAV
ncbi:MAG: carbon-nitrogen hydrolase family protein [Phycisphaerae bacterium]